MDDSIVLQTLSSKTSRKVYIVVDRDYDPDDVIAEINLELLENAYTLLNSAEVIVAKCSARKILSINIECSEIVFVIASFRTRIYNYLSNLNYTIYTGLAITQSLLRIGRIIRSKSPLISLTMTGTEITFDGFSDEQKKIYSEKIVKMGSVYSEDFCESTTHMVATKCDPQSLKYRIATNRNIPVLSLKWIDDAYEQTILGNIDYFSFEHVNLRDNRVPIFMNCVFTCSGFPPSERSNITKALVSNGGRFTADMERNTNTHLIINTTTGMKYRRAREWGNIRIVHLNWMINSIKKGFRLDESKYIPGQTCSTQKETNITFMDPEISAILPSHSRTIHYESSTDDDKLKSFRSIIEHGCNLNKNNVSVMNGQKINEQNSSGNESNRHQSSKENEYSIEFNQQKKIPDQEKQQQEVEKGNANKYQGGCKQIDTNQETVNEAVILERTVEEVIQIIQEDGSNNLTNGVTHNQEESENKLLLFQQELKNIEEKTFDDTQSSFNIPPVNNTIELEVTTNCFDTLADDTTLMIVRNMVTNNAQNDDAETTRNIESEKENVQNDIENRIPNKINPLSFLTTELRHKISSLAKHISSRMDENSSAIPETQDLLSQNIDSIIMNFGSQPTNLPLTTQESVMTLTESVINQDATKSSKSNGSTH